MLDTDVAFMAPLRALWTLFDDFAPSQHIGLAEEQKPAIYAEARHHTDRSDTRAAPHPHLVSDALVSLWPVH